MTQSQTENMIRRVMKARTVNIENIEGDVRDCVVSGDTINNSYNATSGTALDLLGLSQDQTYFYEFSITVS